MHMPPEAVYQIYQASKKWIEAAKEFKAGYRKDQKEIEIHNKQNLK